MLIGRVIEHHGIIGKAEFTPQVRTGDFIYYKTAIGKKVLCQVKNLRSTPNKGFHGSFKILDPSAELPKIWENLYLSHQKMNGHIEVGKTRKGEAVRIRVNPLFRHTLVTGKTGTGKTHMQIVMQEEFLRYQIPSLVIDTQGEFIHIDKFSKEAIVVESIDFEDLLSHLKYKRTVVLDLQGLSYLDKAQRCFEILSKLRDAKEKDYKQAGSDVRLLRIPPIIINIDEAEVYAPTHTRTLNRKCRDCIIYIAKRTGKLGLGLIVSSQRIPSLHYDVRSQCNNAVIFHISDSGSRQVLRQLPYITATDLNRVKSFPRGECIITGEMVSHPLLIRVRDIKTPRAKSLDFEKMLGLMPLPVEKSETTQKEMEDFQKLMEEGITYEKLKTKFPVRNVRLHGECLVIPERYFNSGWKNTLKTQACKVVHCPDMPGGSVWLIRKDNLAKVKAMAKEHLPEDKSKRPY